MVLVSKYTNLRLFKSKDAMRMALYTFLHHSYFHNHSIFYQYKDGLRLRLRSPFQVRAAFLRTAFDLSAWSRILYCRGIGISACCSSIRPSLCSNRIAGVRMAYLIPVSPLNLPSTMLPPLLVRIQSIRSREDCGGMSNYVTCSFL